MKQEEEVKPTTVEAVLIGFALALVLCVLVWVVGTFASWSTAKTYPYGTDQYCVVQNGRVQMCYVPAPME